MDQQFNMSTSVDLNDTTAILCEQCGHQAFVESLLLRTVPAVLSPNGKQSIVPITVFECSSCGHINDQFWPKNLKRDGDVEEE